MKLDKDNQIVLGVDFSKDGVSLCYYEDGFKEPKSISFIINQEEFLMPCVIARAKNKDEWYVGYEAKLKYKVEKLYFIENLIQKIKTDDKIQINNDFYHMSKVLSIYFGKLFENFTRITGYTLDKVDRIGISIEKTEKVLFDTIYKSFELLSINKEKLKVIEHSESFIYFMLNQDKALWMNDVMLFDFSEQSFIYRRFTLARGRQPGIISVYNEDHTKEINYQMINNNKSLSEANQAFIELLNKELKNIVVSSAFLTGRGFYDGQLDSAIKVLCERRRVFLGNNLYAKAVTYAAFSKYKNFNPADYIFNCPGRTKITISLFIEREGKNMELILSKAGENWYEAGATGKFILDDIKEIPFKINSPLTKFSDQIIVKLNDFPERPNKATKIEVSLSYKSEEQFVIAIKDLGFGEFFKSSQRVIQKVYDVEDYI